MTGDNGTGEAQPEPKPTVIAQIAIDSSGQLLLTVAGIVADPIQFGLSAIQLLAQFVREQHAKAAQAQAAIAKPTLVLPPSGGRRR